MSKENYQNLIASVAREIAEFQNAGSLVDEAVAQQMGINRTDQRCLGLLWDQGAMGAGQLASAIELSPGAMTAALDRLERLGYIQRVRSSTDRRSVIGAGRQSSGEPATGAGGAQVPAAARPGAPRAR